MHLQMHAHSNRLTQTPTHAIPSVKHSRIFVQCFIADTFSTPQCLYSISCCPCSRKELKLFVSPTRRRQAVQFTLISLYLSGSGGQKSAHVSCVLPGCDHDQEKEANSVPLELSDISDALTVQHCACYLVLELKSIYQLISQLTEYESTTFHKELINSVISQANDSMI